MKNPAPQCELPTTGFTYTATSVHAWAHQVTIYARERLGPGAVIASLWPYRDGSTVGLACDFSTDVGTADARYDITFTEGGKTDLSASRTSSDCVVYDLADAIHMASLVVRGLDAKLYIGRWSRERNPEIQAFPAPAGAPASPMAKAGDIRVPMHAPDEATPFPAIAL